MATFTFIFDIFDNKQTLLFICTTSKSVDVVTKASLLYYAPLYPNSLYRQVTEIVVKILSISYLYLPLKSLDNIALFVTNMNHQKLYCTCTACKKQNSPLDRSYCALG